MEVINLARYFADFLYKNGALNTEILEIKNGNIINFMVLCTVPNKHYAQGLLVDLLDYAKTQFNLVNLGLEGYKKADWVIVDFGKIFVHIFQEKARAKFNIEKLWK